MSQIEKIIKEVWRASNERKACRVILKDEPFPRVIHPYGVSQTSANKVVLVCRQVSGYTQGGGTEGYRNLRLERITEVEIMDAHFEVDEGFDPTNSQYKDWVYHI